MDSSNYHLGFEESNEQFQTGGFKYNNDEDNQIVHAQPNSQYNLEIQYGEYQDDEYDQQEHLQKEVAQVVNNFVENQFHQLDEAVEEHKSYESVPNNFDEENDFDNSGQQYLMMIGQPIKQIQKVPKGIKNNIQNYIKQFVSRKVKNKAPLEQVQTKNLPNHHCRSILKYAKNQNNNFQGTTKLSRNKVNVAQTEQETEILHSQNSQSILKDEEIRQQANGYFTSFQFLDDMLIFEKQQDVRPPIKQLNKMYSDCLNRSSLNYSNEP